MVQDHMKQGHSLSSFGAVIGCGRQTIYDWRKKHKKFEEACRKAQALALLYYERLLQAKLTGAKVKVNEEDAVINTTLLIFALKTRFHADYSEKKQEEVKPKGNLIIDMSGNE